MRNLAKLGRLMEEQGLDVIIVLSPDNVSYFLDAKIIGDAPLILRYSRDDVKLYTSALEYYRFRDSLPQDVEVVALSKTIKLEDAEVVEKDFKEIVKENIDKHGKVGLDTLPQFLNLDYLQSIPRDKVRFVSDAIARLRMIKEEWELERIKRAIEITGQAIYRVINALTEESTETVAAGLFEYEARRNGVEEFAFPPLTLFKPGNSYPHNLPTNVKLGKRNLVLMDVGVKHGNRCCDITRMAIWGPVREEERNVVEAVEDALNAAIESIQPGCKAGEVDQKARKTLENRGYGNRFIHGLGHGFGVNVHEAPYIRQGSDHVIEEGMVFTIEPGVYFNGKFGVRIEENVYVSKSKAVVLTSEIERVFQL